MKPLHCVLLIVLATCAAGQTGPCFEPNLGTKPDFAQKTAQHEEVHVVWVENTDALMACWQAQVGSAAFSSTAARALWQESPVLAFFRGKGTVYYLNASLLDKRNIQKTLHRAVAHVQRKTYPTVYAGDHRTVSTDQPAFPPWNSDGGLTIVLR